MQLAVQIPQLLIINKRMRIATAYITIIQLNRILQVVIITRETLLVSLITCRLSMLPKLRVFLLKSLFFIIIPSIFCLFLILLKYRANSRYAYIIFFRKQCQSIRRLFTISHYIRTRQITIMHK